jgi:hypothetical protein
LNISPLLIIRVIDERLCGRARYEQQQQQQTLQFVPFVPFCGGKTVKDLSATVTFSPACNRVALASGLGRVAMMDLVLERSGVSVVR